MIERPPRLARWLLAVLLPADERHAVLRDLDDEFARHVSPERGPRAARAWYWRQVLGSIRPALAMRGQALRRERSGAPPVTFDSPCALEAPAGADRRRDRDADTRHRREHRDFQRRGCRRPSPAAVSTSRNASSGSGRRTRAGSHAIRCRRRTSSTSRSRVAASGAFTSISAFTQGDTATASGLAAANDPSRVIVSMVSPNLFETLQVWPSQGRAFAHADAVDGASRGRDPQRAVCRAPEASLSGSRMNLDDDAGNRCRHHAGGLRISVSGGGPLGADDGMRSAGGRVPRITSMRSDGWIRQRPLTAPPTSCAPSRRGWRQHIRRRIADGA